MDKRGLSVLISTVITIVITLIFTGIFFRWAIPYTKERTNEAEEQRLQYERARDVMIDIKSVEVDTNALLVKIENKGKFPVKDVTVRTTLPEGAKNYKGEEVPAGVYSASFLLEIKFLEVGSVLVFYPEIPSGIYGDGALKDYELVEVIPKVILEDGSEKYVEDAVDRWEK